MPIYEYYCPDNHTIYQFYAKSLSQARSVPKCPDNPAYRMEKMLSRFAVNVGAKESAPTDAAGGPGGGGAEADDPRMEAAMNAMEHEFSQVDENDPRAMGRMMRRMAELTGEKIEGEMEEVVRKLEEGADPDSLEEQLGGGEGGPDAEDDPYGDGPMGGPPEPKETEAKESRTRYRTNRSATRDPKLYDFE